MSWEASWILFGFVLLHALAALLLLGIDALRGAQAAEPRDEGAVPDRPPAEERLREALERWRERPASGGILPPPAGTRRGRGAGSLDRWVA